jgi:long-chain acyl-CoA synthetase
MFNLHVLLVRGALYESTGYAHFMNLLDPFVLFCVVEGIAVVALLVVWLDVDVACFHIGLCTQIAPEFLPLLFPILDDDVPALPPDTEATFDVSHIAGTYPMRNMSASDLAFRQSSPLQSLQGHADQFNPVHKLYSDADQYPDTTAVIAGEEKWTYRQLTEWITKLAQGLTAHGVLPGDRIALHLTNKPELIVAYYACMLTGIIAVPINTRLKTPELESLLRRTTPKLYVGQADLYEAVRQVEAGLPAANHIFLVDNTAETGVHRFAELYIDQVPRQVEIYESADSIAVLLLTSGTTGEPKFVAHTARSLAHTVRLFHRIDFVQSDVSLGICPMVHVSGLTNMLFILGKGATWVLQDRFNAEAALDLIERHRCTCLTGLAFMHRELIRHQHARPRSVCSLRSCYVGGDTPPPRLQDEFLALFGARLRNLLAMSESVGSFTYGFQSGQISRPLIGDCVRLVDEYGNDVPRGEAGELALRGDNLFAGYWLGPERVDSARDDGWWRTGDVLREDDNGNLWYVARKKNLIVRGGSNISPVEVEHALLNHPGVSDVAVVGIDDIDLGQRVVAFLELADNYTQTEDILRSAAELLADYKLPEHLLVVQKIPRNNQGKVDRVMLKRIGAEAIASGPFESPASLALS